MVAVRRDRHVSPSEGLASTQADNPILNCTRPLNCIKPWLSSVWNKRATTPSRASQMAAPPTTCCPAGRGILKGLELSQPRCWPSRYDLDFPSSESGAWPF